MTARRRMGTALLLSLAAHALLLSAGGSKQPARPAPLEAGRLTVSLQHGAAVSRQAPEAQEHDRAVRTAKRSAPAPRPRAASIEPKVPAQAHNAATAVREANSGAATERTPPPERTSAEAGDGTAQPSPGARQAVLARLESELARHFHYPLLARRRGWEGEVVLNLRLDGQGRIDSMEIAKTSGHGILDRAALDAVTKISRIPDAAELLGGAGMHLQLPVIYRLREG